jgi:hypothetical protein
LARLSRIPSLVVTALIIACTMRRSAIWVDSARLDRLEFWVADSHAQRRAIPDLQLLRVGQCGNWPNVHMMWEASGHLISRGDSAIGIRYGSPPPGLSNRREPVALTPGCYMVEASGTGVSASACFEVRSDGQVLPLRGGTLKCEHRDRAT